MLTPPVEMSRTIVDNLLIFLELRIFRKPHNSLKTGHIRACFRTVPKAERGGGSKLPLACGSRLLGGCWLWLYPKGCKSS